MATPAAKGDAPSSIDNLKPPDGVVLPPRDIRSVVEKTAGYVTRNGAVFESRIRDKESKNPKFSFLNPSDAYHPFYQWRLEEIKEGRGTDIAAGRVGEASARANNKPPGPPAPPEFTFSARMPRINQKDLDILRITAIFVARHGRQWMTQLAQRETGNPQFQFLIPNHTLHNFFQHTVDQYDTILKLHGVDGEGGRLMQERISELEANLNDPNRILARARQRADYAKHQEAEKQKKEVEEEQKKVEFARIDWSDFVVVETITFGDADETANLPPPTNLSELQYASLEDRNKASISASLRIEEAMPGDEDFTSNGYSAVALQPAHPLPAQPSPALPPVSSPHQQGQAMPLPEPYPSRPQQPPAPTRDLDDVRSTALHAASSQSPLRQPQNEARGSAAPMKIKENYVPRAAQRAATRQGTQMALCPNCKQQIPMNELEAHMRIELLDPSWKEQKAKAESRYGHSTISHADVANNLKRLASQRSDVFDPITGQAISEDELARRKKAAIQSFDGNAESKSQTQMNHMQSFNVEEQIRAIHQKFSEKK